MEENIKISSEFEDEYLENEDSSQKDKYITFILGKEEYAIGIEFVKEIIGIQNITRLPDVDEYVMGVINLRGKIIPIVDMRLRFSLEQIPFGDRTCIIVLNIGEFTTGLVVDEVSEVLDILPSLLVCHRPPQRHVNIALSEYSIQTKKQKRLPISDSPGLHIIRHLLLPDYELSHN
jgi:purine-binding chemotaxis protein CheW